MNAAPASQLPPSVKADWIGGHLRRFRKRPTEFLTDLSHLGDVTFFRLGPQPAYFVNNPELVRDVLVTNAHKFMKGRALQRAKALLGEGLLTSEGADHLRQRRMIQPAFHRQRIAGYSRVMVDYASQMAATWNDGEVRDMDREMMRLTLRIVGQTLFGVDVEREADEIGEAMTSIVNLFDFLVFPFSEWLEKLPLPQSGRFHRSRDKLNSVIYGIIAERRASGEDRGDLLSMLLAARDEDDGSRMTDLQVRDEALTLFLAGHETTANALTFTCYLLSQNPDAAVKLHAELDSVLAGRPPNFEDLPALPYAEAVLAESMRLYPPAWAIGRLSLEEHSLGGYTLPRGSLVLISPFVTQRDERFWHDAAEFIPERWREISIKEAGQKFTYFPFGGGVRRCIGESFAWTEGILLLAAIAQQWQPELLPEQRIGLKPLITLRPRYGMKMRLRKRSSA